MLNKWKSLDPDIYRFAVLVLLTLAVSLQILILTATVFSFIPIKLDASLDAVLPQVLALFRPEREMAFYQFFIVLTVGIHAAVVALFRNRIAQEAFMKRLVEFLVVEYIWIALLLFAAFKILVFKEPVWARAMFFVLLAFSIAGKVFWIELRRGIAWVNRGLAALPRHRWCGWFLDGIFCLWIGLCLWVPDPSTALGRMIVADRLYHFDSGVISPAWAAVKGAILNVDVFSPLGAVFPTLLGKLALWTGGFTYEHVLQVMIGCAIVYGIALYVFVRTTLVSRALAMFTTLLLIKLHFFHISVAPLVWTSPEATLLRSPLDLAVLYFVWRHSQQGGWRLLVGAAVIAGAALAYMPDTGLYLTIALYGYLLVTAFMTPAGSSAFQWPRDLRKCILLGGLPWLTAFLLLWMILGPHAWSMKFWTNTAEFMNFFWQGLGNMPLYSGLRDRQFFALAAGVVIPVFYVITLFAVGLAVRMGQMPVRHLWVTALCFYGLAGHWSYVNRSEATMYYASAMPLALVIGWWIRRALTTVSGHLRRAVHVALVCAAALGLATNILFINYPNALNLSGHNWDEEKQIWSARMFSARDRQLVEQAAAAASQPVAVIASFSTKLLIDTGRAALFYYSPVVVSSLAGTGEFRGTTLLTRERLERTIGDLHRDPAPIVIEKRLYNLSIPKEYERVTQSWLMLKNFLVNTYEVTAEGDDLLLLKRKLSP